MTQRFCPHCAKTTHQRENYSRNDGRDFFEWWCDECAKTLPRATPKRSELTAPFSGDAA